MRRCLVTLLLATALSLPASAQTGKPRPNFSGQWTMNTRLSDPIQPPQAKSGRSGQGGGGRGSGRGGGRGGGGGRHGGVGGGGGSGGGGGNPGQQNPVKNQQRAARLQQELAHLEIFHDGIELDVTNGLDITRLIYTDGRTMNIWTQRGEANATANWEGETLVVQWKTRQDTMSRIRRYTIDETTNRLTVTEKRRLPGSDKYQEMVLIYDRAD